MASVSYGATREAVRDICCPFTWEQIKSANKAMKRQFGNRLSQISGGQDTITYSILCMGEDGEWEMDDFTFDFFYGLVV